MVDYQSEHPPSRTLGWLHARPTVSLQNWAEAVWSSSCSLGYLLDFFRWVAASHFTRLLYVRFATDELTGSSLRSMAGRSLSGLEFPLVVSFAFSLLHPPACFQVYSCGLGPMWWWPLRCHSDSESNSMGIDQSGDYACTVFVSSPGNNDEPWVSNM